MELRPLRKSEPQLYGDLRLRGLQTGPAGGALKTFVNETEGEAMEIILTETTDPGILALFSEHDEYMLDFLGEDRIYYTRYRESEKLEKVWAARENGRPVGCIAYREKDAGVGEVKRLFIKKEYRGQGISKELLRALETYAREQGCHTLYLDTRITLEPAVSLYRASGFQIIFQQGLYVQMEKPL